MKINKIEVTNFKAIAREEVEFNGCSAIITGGNDKGKTSLLRGLIDRLRGEKPEIILREGEQKGIYIIELTDGSRIEWKFTQKTESFAYITKEGIKQTTGIIKAIGKKYFGIKFDIDKFLNSGPKDQVRELQNIVGLDFEEINERYLLAYKERTEANVILRDLRNNPHNKPEIIDRPNLDKLYLELEELKKKNIIIQEKWEERNEIHIQSILNFNKTQRRLSYHRDSVIGLSESLRNDYENTIFEKIINYNKMEDILANLDNPEDEKPVENLPKVTLISVNEIEEKIKEALEQNDKYIASEQKLQYYKDWMEKGKKANEDAEKCDKKVKEIEAEKKTMLNEAEMPKEFNLDESGILYKGLPLSNNQLSSSGKYIAALKLGAMVLGKVKTLHFDASFLDRENLEKIESWATENDLQLLIERPDFDGGEIKYNIIED